MFKCYRQVFQAPSIDKLNIQPAELTEPTQTPLRNPQIQHRQALPCRAWHQAGDIKRFLFATKGKYEVITYGEVQLL